jgi:hypothetical protein
MSDFYSQLVDGLRRSGDPHDLARAAWLDGVMATGRAAAERSATRTGLLGDSLGHLPSSATPIDVDGARGIHFLRRDPGLLGGYDYCARVDVPGVLPRFVMHTIARGDAADGDVGPRQRLRTRALDGALTARTRAPDVLRAFDNDLVADGIGKASLRVSLVVIHDRLSMLEVDVGVGDGRHCERAASRAFQFAGIAVSLARAGMTFAERAADGRPAPEKVEALVQQLSSSVAWLSGPVARVGDGVEARLALDEQHEHPCALRVDIDDDGHASMFFRGPLQAAPERRTILKPQAGFIERLRALVDGKIGDASFDDAWLVDGDVDGARSLAVGQVELQRLRRLLASLELGPEGLQVRVPPFELDDETLVDAASSALSLWRTLVIRAHGLTD